MGGTFKYLFSIITAAWLGSSPIAGYAQELNSGFTFKRVSPPSAGQKKRITVQVEKTWPYETDQKPEPKKEGEPAQDDAEEVPGGWFWAEVSDDIEAADPLRLDQALSALNSNPSKLAEISPGAKLMDRLVKEHGADILLATAGKRVSPAFALAVIAVESGGRVDAQSEKGAQGLMQLIPATAERFGVNDRLDPKENISGGVAYLDWLMGKFGGDAILSLAGYNAGENAVIQNNGVPPFAETRAYVPKVIAAWDRARRYCKTMPKYADDGCVFEMNRSFAN